MPSTANVDPAYGRSPLSVGRDKQIVEGFSRNALSRTIYSNNTIPEDNLCVNESFKKECFFKIGISLSRKHEEANASNINSRINFGIN